MSARRRRSRSNKTKDECTLFVTVKGSQLPQYITGQHIKEHFEQFSDDIVTSRVWREKETMKSKGYAFIEFTSSSIATEAMRTLQGSLLRGKFPLLIKYAKQSSDSGSSVVASDSDSDVESENDSDSATLYVGVFNSKFPNYVNSGHLKQHFADFEEYIKNAMIVRDMLTKETKGYGFVTFTSHAAAELAMKKLRGSKLHGKFKLYINMKEGEGSRSTTPSLSHSRASSTIDLSSPCTLLDDCSTDQSEGACTLYVSVQKSKFPNHINSRHLESHFSEFNEHMKKAIIVRDMKTKESKGFGLVTFSSHTVALGAMRKLRGSKLNGKFSLFISLKDKTKHSTLACPMEDEESLVPLRGTPEQLLYLRYRFYNFPTGVSSGLMKSLPAQVIVRDGTLYLLGTENARRRSTSQIHASELLQNLKSCDFSEIWDRYFVNQLCDTILPPINNSEQDILCIITEKQEQGPDKISFVVQLFSHSIMILQDTHQKLTDLKPQSKLYQLRPEFATVSGLTNAYLSIGKDHCTRIDKEAGQGVRIHGLRAEDVHSCWAALKSFVDDRITVNIEINIGFWQAKYLQSKCSKVVHALEAEGCKIDVPITTTKQENDKVKVVLTGNLKTTKQASERIKNVISECEAQSFKLSCDKKYLSLWIKRWKEFVKEQKGNLIIDVQHSVQNQPGGNQVVEFTIVGTDSAAVAQVKNDIVRHENGSKDKLAKLDVSLTAPDFIVASKFLKEIETKLTQTYNVLVVLDIDHNKNVIELFTAPNMSSLHLKLKNYVTSFIASKTVTQKSVSNHIAIKDNVVGSLLTSRTKYLPKLEQEGAKWCVSVQPEQSSEGAFTVKIEALEGSQVHVKIVEIAIKSLVKDLTASIKHDQLVLSGHNLSIMCTEPFKMFCSQLLKELHVECKYYPPVGGDLLRQVQLRTKPSHLLTLQIAIGHLKDEVVDTIVIPAESRDKTMTNSEMNFEYFQCLHKKPLTMGEIACIDSGTFPSRKALHVLLPKSCEEVEKQVEFVTACTKTLDCASLNQFGSLTFPALGVDDTHKISTTLCINTLLYAIDKHCLESNSTTLHTVRIVVTQDLSPIVLHCFDKYTFCALQRKQPAHLSSVEDSKVLPIQYEWYWEDDKKAFTKYSTTISKALTQAKLTIPNKKCLFEVNSQSYFVDLSTMTQTNVTSGFVRKVMCKKMPSCAKEPQLTVKTEVQWYYRDDKRKFTAYSPSDSAQIEDMYHDVSPIRKHLYIQSRVYRFDFDNMKQMNVSTKYQRDIKREELTRKQEYRTDTENTEIDSFQCIVNLRGTVESLQKAKKMVKDKLESLAAFKNVPLPVVSTPALKKKLCSIARRHSVSSCIKDEEKPTVSGAQQRRYSQVIRIEGAEHLVDKAVTEVQGVIIEFQSSSASLSQLSTQYPPEWEPQTSTSQLFDVSKYSREWIRVTSLFNETMSDADIISIRRIQNKRLWGRYVQQKDWVHEKNNGLVNEKELWHGSKKSSADNIHSSEEGFDMRYSSEGLWGQANYFAEKASYSDKYAFTSPGGTKELLLAKVLTGDSFESPPDQSLRMPPEKSSSQSSNVQLKQIRYDSVNGTTCGCRVYMTYTNDKAYPAYLICYSSPPKNTTNAVHSVAQLKSPTQSAAQRQTLLAQKQLLARLRARYTGFTQ